MQGGAGSGEAGSGSVIGSNGGGAGGTNGNGTGGSGVGGQSMTGASGSGAGNGGAAVGVGGGSGGASGAGVAGGDSTGSGGTAGQAGSGPGGAAGRSIDGGPSDVRVDASAPHPIPCGNVTCFAPEQFCCIPNAGNPRCAATVGGNCAANGDKLYCDDRTDCASTAQICCATDVANGSSVAECRLLSACTGPAAQVLCDPRDTTSCVGSGTTGRCGTNGQVTIDGYAFCR
jgi:hypothetical protein